MHGHRTASVLASGDELALGQARDTNSGEIAGVLTGLGLRVLEHAVVPDDLDLIAAALARLAASSDVVVMTGGLGPTRDDLTREALSRVLGEPLELDAGALEGIEAFFAARGRAMPELNRVQAMRPRGARSLANPHGTAPGLAACVRSPSLAGHACDVFCLPGPPREMRPMLETFVRPAIRPARGRRIITRVIPTCGLGESVIAERLGELMRRDRNPLVGTTASGGIVSCRVRWEGHKGVGDGPGDALVDRDEDEIRRRLGTIVIGSSRASGTAPTLPEVLIELLRARGRTLALAESCTGGLLGGAITGVPGSSGVFLGGWTTYANAMKTSCLGVEPATIERFGAVSAECAEGMAKGALEHAAATDALAVTGIAGPGGGTPSKPVGTVWIGRAWRDKGSSIGVETRRFLLGQDRATIRERAVVSALNLLRLRLLGGGNEPLTWEAVG